MSTLIVVRAVTGPLRCAACHDELLERRSTCPGCRAVLHLDCRADLARCPTPGCRAGAVTRARGDQKRGPLFHLVWLIPGLLTFVWPLWVAIFDLEDPAANAAALAVGPVIGHAVLAPLARTHGDPGSPHVRALIAEAVGLGASFPVIVLYYLVLVVALC